MSLLKCQISMSLDGFVAGPNQGGEYPLGEGGMALHEWVFALQAWQASHGHEGGEVNASTPVVEEMQRNVGAVIMGRNMFGPIRGPWGERAWNGWWGDDPPFHVPVFVLTHHRREPLEMQGGTTFHFVTDGVESAYEQARAAAGEDKDILVGGGGSAIQQCLAAGLVDELTLNVVPIFLGDGVRLLDGLRDANLDLACTRVIKGPAATHLTYRVAKHDAGL
jgi:dihydrofolate reductase